MQRVSALLPTWDRTRIPAGPPSAGGPAGKASLEIVRGWADRLPTPTKRLSTVRTGKEAFLPSTLDKECDRAARILKSFCTDGFIVVENRPTSPSATSGSTAQMQIIKRIPPRIIQNAVGLAVFTTMRSGVWTSGSGGSGILLARKSDGTWSPPSGLMIQSGGLGFVLGADIYDCVLVINNSSVLETFSRPKISLGSDVSLSRGPLLTIGVLESDVTWADLSDTVFSYVKTKGQVSEFNLNGTSLNERADENERFYGAKYTAAQICAGEINQSLPQTRTLTEMLKAAEGRTDYDAALLEQIASQPVPGDATMESPSSVDSRSPSFGIPDMDDPDPFGVLALEMAGMEIREAGTRLRPESNQFDYIPSPTSPAFPRMMGRQSVDTFMSQSNRGSYMSSKTVLTERSQMTDAGTQTVDFTTPETTPSPSQSEDGNQHPSIAEELPTIEEPKEFKQEEEEEEPREPVEVDYTKIDISALRKLSNFPDLEDTIVLEEPTTKRGSVEESGKLHAASETEADKASSAYSDTENDGDADDEDDPAHESSEGELDEDADGDNDDDDDDDDDDDFEEAEEPVVFEVATAQPPRSLGAAQVVQAKGSMVNISVSGAQVVQAKGSMVNIPKRIPPPLPTRSPARLSRQGKNEMGDLRLVSSPLRQEFEFEDPQPDEAVTPRPGEEFDHSEVMSGAAEVDGPIALAVSTDERPSTATRMSAGYFPVDSEHAADAVANAEANADVDADADAEAETVGTQTSPALEKAHDVEKVDHGISISVV